MFKKFALVLCSLTLASCVMFLRTSESQNQNGLKAPNIDGTFWGHWGDGQAEVSGYELTFPRYGLGRSGRAVTIFCTETFSDSARVKADPGRHPKTDEFSVLKLNLIQDYPTGVYDYNQMASTFVAIAPRHGHDTGHPTKVSFSCQEWCGHVYHQLLFDKAKIRSTSHSYFDGEGDSNTQINRPERTMSEDTLFHWARGFAAPQMNAGETVKLKLTRSLEICRLLHKDLAVEDAELSHKAGVQTIEVPAGKFEVVVKTAKVAGSRTWTFYVEKAAPHRLIRWTSTLGHDAKLLKSQRMRYWGMNGAGYEKSVEQLGLKKRARRTM